MLSVVFKSVFVSDTAGCYCILWYVLCCLSMLCCLLNVCCFVSSNYVSVLISHLTWMLSFPCHALLWESHKCYCNWGHDPLNLHAPFWAILWVGLYEPGWLITWKQTKPENTFLKKKFPRKQLKRYFVYILFFTICFSLKLDLKRKLQIETYFTGNSYKTKS